MLDELLARLNGLDPKARAEVEKAALEATRGMKWLPNPGPQTEAYFSPAQILLYGGQGGGGKSDLGLGLAFTAHRRSLILRRKYANLGSLTERALEINGSRNGYNGSPPPLLRTDDGRYIQFAGNQHLGDEQDWQGQPFDLKCVERGTPVLMGDGSYRPIETLRRGDLVQTLEGPRKVLRRLPRRVDEAVKVSLFDDLGSIIGEQVQSRQHSLLTTDGWISADSYAASHRAGSCGSIQSRFAGKSEPRSVATFGLVRSLREGLTRGCWRASARLQWLWGYQSASGVFAFSGQGVRGSGCGASYGGRQDDPPLALSSAPQGPERHSLSSGAYSGSRSTFWIRNCGARFWSALQGWLGRCLSGSHLCGGHAHRSSGPGCGEAVGLVYLRQSFGVGQPSPTHSASDDRGRTPKHTRHIASYVHPYTKEIRRAAVEAGLFAMSWSPVGTRELYDIEVDEANHYITKCGLINKNCFDEATQFLEAQVRFHIGWIRTTDEGQRTRAVLATNPPVDADGDWIIGMFRPWLDVTHPNPAGHGELRWYVTAPDGSDMEVGGPDPVQLPGAKEPAIPMSRTFIPAALKDNPYLVNSGYQANLDGLPEPIRSAVRDGNFMAARSDADYQVIPTQWIIEAQARWSPDGHKGNVMSAMALDIGAGRDETVCASRFGGWYSPLEAVTGEQARDPAHAAGLVLKHRKGGCPVVIDVGGGFGGASMVLFKENGIPYRAFNGASASTTKTKDGKLSFVNKRAEAWWKFREELDPGQQGGSAIALPPDPQLRADLAAPTWKLTTRGIQIESKDDIKARIGRSPDRGDAVTMAMAEGDLAIKRAVTARMARPMQTTANLGRPAMRRR